MLAQGAGKNSIGDIKGAKVLEEAYDLGVLINDKIPRHAQKANEASSNSELLNHIDKLHTTELGVVRIKRNLSLDTDDVVAWYKDKISLDHAIITRRGAPMSRKNC